MVNLMYNEHENGYDDDFEDDGKGDIGCIFTDANGAELMEVKITKAGDKS